MSAWRYSLVAAMAAVVAGCGSNALPETQAVQKRLSLEGFANCEQLEQYVEDTAVLDMRATLEQYKQGNGGWWGGRMEMSMDASASGSAPPSGSPNNYTTTNTQVGGVDEADFVKNDGNRIFVLSGNRLYVNQSWPAEELKTLSTLEIEGYPREMFLDEHNRVVIFSGVYTPYAFDRSSGDVWCSSMWCGYSYSNTVKVTVVDVADLTRPLVKEEFYLPGSYSNSRRVGASVRLVVSDHFRWPAEVQWWVDGDQGLYQDKARTARAWDDLMAKNEKVIRQAKLSDWLPSPQRRQADGSLKEEGYACSDFYRANGPTKLGLVTVATLNLDQPQNGLTRTSVVAESGEIYASAQHLYLASGHWWWWPSPGQTNHTYLHKFDITHPDKAVYVASGGVDGRIVDQFSMDEHNGFFRVATTVQTRIRSSNPDNWWGEMQTTNRVSVLGEKEGALQVVGQTPEMAPGESITSSRFVGDTGYVVTFEQVDPLFTLDLKDPTSPKVVGELKIPGFSTYIHPIDAHHLLTIGVFIDENLDWRTRSLQLSLFDVSDLKNPKQKFTHKVGTAYGWSEAASQHKAFNYFAAKKLLAIPFYDYQPNHAGSYWDNFVSDLRVFEVDTLLGFTAKGAVSMKDVYSQTGDYQWDYYWSPWVRRSVMADDYVYAISDSGIRAAHISNLSVPLATAAFQKSVGQK